MCHRAHATFRADLLATATILKLSPARPNMSAGIGPLREVRKDCRALSARASFALAARYRGVRIAGCSAQFTGCTTHGLSFMCRMSGSAACVAVPAPGWRGRHIGWMRAEDHVAFVAHEINVLAIRVRPENAGGRKAGNHDAITNATRIVYATNPADAQEAVERDAFAVALVITKASCPRLGRGSGAIQHRRKSIDGNFVGANFARPYGAGTSRPARCSLRHLGLVIHGRLHREGWGVLAKLWG